MLRVYFKYYSSFQILSTLQSYCFLIINSRVYAPFSSSSLFPPARQPHINPRVGSSVATISYCKQRVICISSVAGDDRICVILRWQTNINMYLSPDPFLSLSSFPRSTSQYPNKFPLLPYSLPRPPLSPKWRNHTRHMTIFLGSTSKGS